MWTWVDIGPTDGWFGVQAGNFYTWLFITFGFSLLTRWLRDRAARRRGAEWLQLLVPVPAYAILIASIIPYAVISARTNAPTGGALWLSFVCIGLFVMVALRGVFGPGRQPPDGQMAAIVDLRLAFFTRLSIQGFFLLALLIMGIATELPVLLVTSVVLILVDVWLSRLIDQRRAAAGLAPARAVLAPVAARVRQR
jgi:hypothetical protein